MLLVLYGEIVQALDGKHINGCKAILGAQILHTFLAIEYGRSKSAHHRTQPPENNVQRFSSYSMYMCGRTRHLSGRTIYIYSVDITGAYMYVCIYNASDKYTGKFIFSAEAVWRCMEWASINK